jgi:hypothetical protein
MMNKLAQLSSDTIASAEALGVKLARLQSLQQSGNEILERIVGDLTSLRDLPSDVLALEKDVDVDAAALGRLIAKELAAMPTA